MKKLNGLFCILALVICFSVILVGCGSQTEEKNISSGTDSYLTITDDADRQVVLTKKTRKNSTIISIFFRATSCC